MKNNKLIHTRVSDTLYDVIVQKSEENKMTVSGYSRVVFENSIHNFTNFSDPFEADDFNNLMQWIIFIRFFNIPAGIHDVRHNLNVLNKYFPYLDVALQVLLDPVRQSLNELVRISKIDMDRYPVLSIEQKYSIDIEIESLDFDYKKFTKYLRNK